ncbi:MAG: hypothetical protein JO022_13440 [Acidobacteriaceae bacterium]|nr:hypothetical protein [Acidobacteriaceae bacterium]
MKSPGGRVFGSLLASAIALWAQTIYTDPNGRFSVQVPPGWQTSTDPASGQVTLSNGPVSASLGVGATNNGSTPKPADLLAAVQKQAEPACPGAEVTQRGQTTLAGLPGTFLVLSCKDPKGPSILKFSVATTQGKVIVFNTTGPATLYSQAVAALNAMAQSLRLASGTGAKSGGSSAPTAATADANKLAALKKACAAGVFTPEECAAKHAELTGPGPAEQPAPAAPQQSADSESTPAATQPASQASSTVYRDAQGRFSVDIPPGWTADPQGENGSQGVKLSAGSSWALIGPFGGATNAADVVVKLATQFQSQYKNFSMAKHAPVTSNGHAAEYGVFTGVNPQGTRVTLMIAGIAAGGDHYLAMMTSCPWAEANQTTGVFVQVFHSIRVE